jgi:hypothetical protein
MIVSGFCKRRLCRGTVRESSVVTGKSLDNSTQRGANVNFRYAVHTPSTDYASYAPPGECKKAAFALVTMRMRISKFIGGSNRR